MSHFNDDADTGPDESEDTDATARELRAEIIRLEAQLDQLAASVRERIAEAAVTQARRDELERHVARLLARRRRDEKLLLLAWALVAASVALSLYTYFTS